MYVYKAIVGVHHLSDRNIGPTVQTLDPKTKRNTVCLCTKLSWGSTQLSDRNMEPTVPTLDPKLSATLHFALTYVLLLLSTNVSPFLQWRLQTVLFRTMKTMKESLLAKLEELIGRNNSVLLGESFHLLSSFNFSSNFYLIISLTHKTVFAYLSQHNEVLIVKLPP